MRHIHLEQAEDVINSKETLYLVSSTNNLKNLRESIIEIEEGKIIKKDGGITNYTEEIWSIKSWNDYEYLKQYDPRTCSKIDSLLGDIYLDLEGYRKCQAPIRLKAEFSNYLSKKISKEHRLVYRIDEDRNLYIIQCKFYPD